MRQITITEEVFEVLYDKVTEFEQKTSGIYCVEVGDILYSFFRSTEHTFALSSDWDEGPENDPFWDTINDRHSVVSFLVECVEYLNTI